MYYDFFNSKVIIMLRNAAMAATLVSLGALIAWGMLETIVYEWI